MANTGDKSANLFGGGKSGAEPAVVAGPSAPPVASVTGERASGGSFSAWTRKADVVAAAAPGRRSRSSYVDKRLFPGLDVAGGLSRMVKGEVTSEAVMSKDDAGKVFNSLLKRFGLLGTVDEGFIMGFSEQLDLNMAINGTSTFQPGRSEIRIGGSVFEMREAIIALGDDYRRFGRARADLIRMAVRKAYEQEDLDNSASCDLADLLRRNAWNRGMHRYPDLAFDVAEYCSGLTSPEHVAVAASKGLVLSNTLNTPDNALGTGRGQTLDGLQSGIGVAEGTGGNSMGSKRH